MELQKKRIDISSWNWRLCFLDTLTGLADGLGVECSLRLAKCQISPKKWFPRFILSDELSDHHSTPNDDCDLRSHLTGIE